MNCWPLCCLYLLVLIRPFLCASQDVITLYDLQEPRAKLVGKEIEIADDVFDQPTHLFQVDSFFLVMNRFGQRNLVVLDRSLRVINTTQLPDVSWEQPPRTVHHIDDEVYFSLPFRMVVYSWGDLVRLPKVDPLMIVKLPDYRALFLLGEDRWLGWTNSISESDNRFFLLDRQYRGVMGFGKLPTGVFYEDISMNWHLEAQIAVTNAHVYVGYRSTDYLEKYRLDDGTLEAIAHDVNTQFPPAHDVDMQGIAMPSSEFIFFSSLTTHEGKLYALYRNHVPHMPPVAAQKMRLLVFDQETMDLEAQFELDEDLVDLVVRSPREVIGLCAYCEHPIRRYQLH